jgi:peptide/nickel transport system permease protein
VTAQLGAVADTPAAEPAGLSTPIAGRGQLAMAWSRLRKDRMALLAGTVILLLVAIASAAPLIAQVTGHQPDEQFRQTGLTSAGLPVGPSPEFWFGTDNLGRDVFIRVVYGARISLLVGVLSTVLAVAAGLVIGLAAGYLGGAVDSTLARFMDLVLSFPLLLFAIALVSVVGPSVSLAILVIAFFSWAAVGRIVRGLALSIKEREYIEAARALGASNRRIMLIEVLPNLVAPVIVYTTLLIPVAIVFEATLSFLGLGVLPPTPSWGNMLSDSLQYYQVAWWFVLFPGLALLLTTLAFNLFGDSVRDALDPGATHLAGTR